MTSFELNMDNVVNDSDVYKSPTLNAKSRGVEIFSALAAGEDLSKFGADVDAVVEHCQELAKRALQKDGAAIAEINSIVRYAIEPRLLERIKLFNFMGKFRKIPYEQQPMVKAYKYESVDSRWQASSGDVPFATYNYWEYPISTKTISSGFAVDYREMQSGNFDGTIAEGYVSFLLQ